MRCHTRGRVSEFVHAQSRPFRPAKLPCSASTQLPGLPGRSLLRSFGCYFERKAERESEIEAPAVGKKRTDRAGIACAFDVSVCVTQRAACLCQTVVLPNSKNGLYGCP